MKKIFCPGSSVAPKLVGDYCIDVRRPALPVANCNALSSQKLPLRSTAASSILDLTLFPAGNPRSVQGRLSLGNDRSRAGVVGMLGEHRQMETNTFAIILKIRFQMQY